MYGGVRCSLKNEWHSRQSYKLTGSVDTGTAESGAADTLTDNNKNWAENTWVPGAIRIIGGTGDGQYRRIIGNTATTITVATNWKDPPNRPGNGSQYRVINTSTWSQLNDVNNDNQNADGSTNVSWDLNAPSVTSITPNNGTTGTVVSITNLAGTSFAPGATIKLRKTGEADIVAANVVWESVTKFRCVLNLAVAATGSWSVQVNNVDGASDVLSGAFTVNAP